MLNIKTDSRKVEKGDIFVALSGYTVDGHDYIEQAISNGASKIVCEHGEYSVPTLVVDDTKKWLQDYLVTNYKDEINKLKFIGVTGTNGKTTTCFLTYQQLKCLGVNACYIGTIGFYMGDIHYELPNTTPAILDLYSMFLSALENGADTVVMEVSSHALDLNRIEGIEFTTCAFTNLTEDHLDYHKTMVVYLNAKKQIINYLKDDGVMVINGDDEYGSEFLANHNQVLGFNESANIQIKSYQETENGTDITFAIKDGLTEKEYTVHTNLCSKFNVYNYLTSLLLVHNLGYDIEKIIEISDKICAPKGRCEQVNYNGGKIIVDYAHTPDAVEKIISAFNGNNKVITIIGCGGDRDPYKRPIMGRIASEQSNYVIFTSDNPRTEDPNKILNDILAGVEKDNYEVESNRISAVRRGIDLVEEGTVLLVLGKGHEDYQIIGRTKYHLDDMEEILKYLEIKKQAKKLTLEEQD